METCYVLVRRLNIVKMAILQKLNKRPNSVPRTISAVGLVSLYLTELHKLILKFIEKY